MCAAVIWGWAGLDFLGVALIFSLMGPRRGFSGSVLTLCLLAITGFGSKLCVKFLINNWACNGCVYFTASVCMERGRYVCLTTTRLKFAVSFCSEPGERRLVKAGWFCLARFNAACVQHSSLTQR